MKSIYLLRKGRHYIGGKEGLRHTVSGMIEIIQDTVIKLNPCLFKQNAADPPGAGYT